MSIKAKLFASLAVLSAVICIFVTAGFASIATLDAKMGSIVADRVVPLAQLKLVADQYAVLIVDNAHKVRAGTVSFEDGAANMKAAEQIIAEQWSAYLATQLTPEEKTLATDAIEKMTAAEPAMAELRALLQAGDMGGLETFVAQTLYPAIDPISTDVSALVDLQVNVANAEYVSAKSMFGLMNTAMLALTLISVIALGIAALIIARTVSGRLSGMENALIAVADGNYSIKIPSAGDRDEIGRIARAAETFRQNGLKVAAMTEAEAVQTLAVAAERLRMMDTLRDAFGAVVDASVAGDFTRRVAATFPDAQLNELANGVNRLVANVDRGITETGAVLHALAQTDLTKRVEGRYDGAFDKLKSDVNAVADRLTDIVGQLRTTSGAVKGATGEILAGANDLAERTTRQAASIEETSAAMEQLSQTVVENAQRATSAAKNSTGVATSAEQTAAVMEEANTAMVRISQSSAKISSIIGMIDDIAFQTNLLALNASVEAARAGDAGKGFAVVAVEVRRLAQSAAQASSEVKALVEQSASEVEAGSRFVSDAGARLQTMLTGIRDSARLIGDIAAASQEQSSAIAEVTQAVRTMDEMTQHNAALVEQTNAAIEQTETQASELDRIVDIFIIAERPNLATPRLATAEGFLAKGIKGLQAKVASAKPLFTRGNAAVQKDWEAF